MNVAADRSGLDDGVGANKDMVVDAQARVGKRTRSISVFRSARVMGAFLPLVKPSRRPENAASAEKTVAAHRDSGVVGWRPARGRRRLDRSSKVTAKDDLGLDNAPAAQHNVLGADKSRLARNLVARVLGAESEERLADGTGSIGDRRGTRNAVTDRLNILSSWCASRHFAVFKAFRAVE